MNFLRTGYFTGTYRSAIDDTDQPFALWVPVTYQPRKKYPLIIALHGTDADERMIPEQCFQIHRKGFREDVILLSPLGRGDLWYQWMGEADLWDSIGWVKDRYSVDSRRQYLTGLSMGGFATWRLAAHYPEQWAAIAPICGGGNPEWADTLKQIPVWSVHGDRDREVPVENSRIMIDALRSAGASPRYNELKGWGHASWEWVYQPDKHAWVDWFLQFKKIKPAPRRRKPTRRGEWKDLFSERVILSYPQQSNIPHEVEILRSEMLKLARFTFDDQVMRKGRLLVKADNEISTSELRTSNQIMIGRADNHAGLQAAGRRAWARQVYGGLLLKGEIYIGRSLVAITSQPSPWNRNRLLGIITYQQCRRLRRISEVLGGPDQRPKAVNLYDPDRKVFIKQEEA